MSTYIETLTRGNDYIAPRTKVEAVEGMSNYRTAAQQDAIHDSTKQDVISDLTTIRNGASLGATALQSVPDTYRTSAAQDVIDATKANANDVYTKTESDGALLLKQNKSDSSVYISGGSIVGAINNNHEEISNLKAIGRFLAVWNCTTGLPTTEPTTSPYTYKTGDYFLVGTVGDTNYKPNGSTYTIGVASTTVESGEVTVSDYYVYDGTSWILLKNTQKALTFANITGQPSDNTALNTAFAGKVGFTDYPSVSTAGVIRVNSSYGFMTGAGGGAGSLLASTRTYAQYSTDEDFLNIGKRTLENVLTAKNINNVTNETFSFTLSDGTVVNKVMKVGS